jgi:agmatine deiminase
MALRHFTLPFALSMFVLAGTACTQPTTKSTRAAGRYTFPPDWAPHSAVWLGWSDDLTHHPVQVEMVRALTPTVPVRLLVTSDRERVEAKAAFQAAGVPEDRVEFFVHPVSNSWIRDAGPRFLTDGRNLAVADFAWNWYGYPKEMSRAW